MLKSEESCLRGILCNIIIGTHTLPTCSLCLLSLVVGQWCCLVGFSVSPVIVSIGEKTLMDLDALISLFQHTGGPVNLWIKASQADISSTLLCFPFSASSSVAWLHFQALLPYWIWVPPICRTASSPAAQHHSGYHPATGILFYLQLPLTPTVTMPPITLPSFICFWVAIFFNWKLMADVGGFPLL